MTEPVRTRRPHGSAGTQRVRRSRSLLTALLLVLGGAMLGWVLPVWERHLPRTSLSFESSTASATLAAIAGGMITLAGFVVTAITLVVQTVQSMSPRLVAALGHFSRFLVLFGLLVGTALFALVALSDVRDDHVPRLTVTLAVGLVLADAVALLALLSSLRHAVTGGGLARAVGDRLRTVIDEVCPPDAPEAPDAPDAPDAPGAPPCGSRPPGPPDEGGQPLVHRGRPMVVVAIDERRLVRLCARHGLRVRFRHTVGDFVGTGTVVGHLECTGSGAGAGAGAGASPRLVRRVGRCVRYGPSRTVEQDPAYGFRLLADITVRALSPAVNDPTTAVQSLDQIDDGLLRLSGRALGPGWLTDARGRIRVSLPAPYWPDLVSLALDESLLYGASNPQVVRRLRALLDGLLAAVTTEERRRPVAERRDALDRLAAGALPDPLLRQLATRPDERGLGGVTAAASAAGTGPRTRRRARP